jgi:hypothetical protein
VDRIRFITHREQRVLLVDFTDCNPEEVAEIADQGPPTITREPHGSVLLLADFSRSHITREAFERVKVGAALNRPHLKRSAWVLTKTCPKRCRILSAAFLRAKSLSLLRGEKRWTIW